MGCGPFSGRSCNVYPSKSSGSPQVVYQDRIVNANPDPARFEILDTWQVKSNVVAKIKYPDCTNYEGIKICVYKDFTCKRLYDQARLDPHFSNEGVSPIARFKPTNEGLLLALGMCNLIS